jgi:hypothetical protein
LYDDFEGLLTRLRQALLHPAETRSGPLRSHMRRYDWRLMAPQYDRLLEQIAAQGPVPLSRNLEPRPRP